MSGGRALALAAGIFLAIVGAIVALIHFWPDRITLYVDNGTDAEIVARTGDADPLAVPAHEWRKLELPAGQRSVRIGDHASGRELEELQLDGKDDERWVFNVGGENRYRLHKARYGQTILAGMGRPAPEVVGGSEKHLFQILEGEFMTPFPDSVQVPKGTRTVEEARVYHQPIHTDRPCCKGLNP